MYRINYGNGQVSETFRDLRAAMRALRAESGSVGHPACIERYEPGTADDPGDWFPIGIGRWSLPRGSRGK